MSELEVAKVKAIKSATLPNGAPLHIVKERDNKLVKRLEIEGVVVHIGKGTPARSDVIKTLSKLYNKSEELIVVKSILSEYGVGISKIKAHIYDSIERLKAFEPEYILKRHGR